MNYIWDIALRAKQSGMDRDSLFFKQAESCSPWYEQAFSSLNQKEVEKPEIEINTLYRFSSIFGELLHPDLEDLPYFRAYLLDLAVHLLCEIDLQQGLSKHEFYIRRLSREISDGVFGQQNAMKYNLFSAELKGQLSSLVYSQLRMGSSLLLFRKSVTAVCEDSILYQLREKPEQLLLYVGRSETEEFDCKIQFIIDIFLPVNYKIRIFWLNHFGVLGVGVTMQMNEIEIF